jgi:hypothetical protein
MFVYNYLGSFTTNSSIHNFNTRSKNQLHLPTVNLSSIQKGVTYTSLRIFNALPSNLLQLQTNKVSFKSTEKISSCQCILFYKLIFSTIKKYCLVIPFHFVISCSILSNCTFFFSFIIIVLLLYLSHTLYHLVLYFLMRLFIVTLYISILFLLLLYYWSILSIWTSFIFITRRKLDFWNACNFT